MPLPLEPFVLPDDLFGDENRDNNSTELWWVLHTKPRAEKSLVRLLRRLNVSHFLPLFERRKKIQRRVVRSYIPLFPGYVFLRGTDDSRRLALETNLVVHCLEVTDQHELALDLSQIYRMMKTDAPLAPEERLQPGMSAEIVEGPLRGLKGKILRRSGAQELKFVVEVRFLQQGTSVEVDASMIQPS